MLYHYDNYYAYEGVDYYINTNRGYVSTQMYIQNRNKYHYDSFIFGSSRSHVFSIDEWKKYIGDLTSCFHIDGYGESLFLIHAKINYINGKSPIKNALICMDYEMLCQVGQDYGHLWIPHPALMNGSNRGAFHMAHIRTYLNSKFLFAYWDLLLSKESKSYMYDEGIIEKADTIYNLAYNERGSRYPIIKQYPESYYAERKMEFPERDCNDIVYPAVIGDMQKKMLCDIRDILENNQTKYKILLNPTYDQRRLADLDMAYLRDLFEDNIIDFSGKNIFTDDYHYYSDPSHFNTYVSNEMLRIAYEPDSVMQQKLLDSLYYR